MSEAKKYEIDIYNLKQLDSLEKQFKKLRKALESEEFMRFISDKCMVELDKIIAKKLNSEQPSTEYRSSNHSEIGKDYVKIYNDSMVDLSELSPETALNYPEGLSLAQLIEFGTGIPRNT